MKTSMPVILTILLMVLVSCGKEEAPVPKIDLHTAVLTDNLEVIQQHVEAGSDLNVKESSRGSTPIITAAALGRKEAAEILIDAGADINYQNEDGSTALHTAIAFGKTEIAQNLIDAGISLNIKNNDGSTALHTAAFFCNLEIVKGLIEKGADKTIRNKNLKTALEIVEPPFEDVKAAYDAVGERLYPLGITLDYEHIEKTRPLIAEILR